MINSEYWLGGYRDVVFQNACKVANTENLLKRVREFQAVIEDAEGGICPDSDTDEAIGGVLICLDELAAQLETNLKLFKSEAKDDYRDFRERILPDEELTVPDTILDWTLGATALEEHGEWTDDWSYLDDVE